MQIPRCIENGDGITQVIIKNFNNYFPEAVKARVKGDTIYIDPQTFTRSNGENVVRGIGYIQEDKHYAENGKLIMKYEVLTPNALDNYGYAPDTDNPSNWTK